MIRLIVSFTLRKPVIQYRRWVILLTGILCSAAAFAQHLDKFVSGEYGKIADAHALSTGMRYKVTIRYYLPDSVNPQSNASYDVAVFKGNVLLQLPTYDRVFCSDYSVVADHIQKKVYLNEPDIKRNESSVQQVRELKEMMKGAIGIDTLTIGDVCSITFRFDKSEYSSASVSYNKKNYLMNQLAFTYSNGQKIISLYSDYATYPSGSIPDGYDSIVTVSSPKGKRKKKQLNIVLTDKFKDYELINSLN